MYDPEGGPSPSVDPSEDLDGLNPISSHEFGPTRRTVVKTALIAGALTLIGPEALYVATKGAVDYRLLSPEQRLDFALCMCSAALFVPSVASIVIGIIDKVAQMEV